MVKGWVPGCRGTFPTQIRIVNQPIESFVLRDVFTSFSAKSCRPTELENSQRHASSARVEQGSDGGGSWFIENVREELDFPNEFFFDATARELLYVFNTSKAPADVVFESTELKVLLSVKGKPGDGGEKARGISIQGIEFRGVCHLR